MKSKRSVARTYLFNDFFYGSAEALAAMNSVNSAMIAITTTQFGIHSPSRVEAEFGKYLMLGRAQGIQENANEVYEQVSAVNSEMMDINNRLMQSMDIAMSFYESTYSRLKLMHYYHLAATTLSIDIPIA